MGIVPSGSGTDIKSHPVGTGPFRFVSMTQDEEVDFDRNADYFDDAGAADPPADPPQTPNRGSASPVKSPAGEPAGKLVQHIRFRVVPDAVVRALELRKGSADIGGVNSLVPDMVVALARDRDVAVTDQQGTALAYVSFNFSDTILAHREVRQALAYATDRQSIIRYLLRGQAQLAIGQLPPGHWALDTNVKQYDYNPDEANRLLDRAGFPRGSDGIRMHLTMKTSPEEGPRLLGETLAAQWKRVGVILELRPLETATFFSDLNHGSFQLYTLRWLGVNNDPAFYEFVFSSAHMPPNGYNRGHYSNPALDALIAKERVETDREKQKAIVWQIQQIVAEDEPYLNLWFSDTVCVHRASVTNIDLSPAGDYNFLENVRLQ
jgi:peptide/nickel transport system substrate-binding protein